MAGSGLIALLDDIATIADDVATLTVAATKKASGVVTDDMAVTAEQTLGLAREREIPVVLRVARGSLFNKAVLLAPGALLLNWIAPWTIGPLLMAGGLFLCFEGVEKVLHRLRPHHDAPPAGPGEALAPRVDPETLETERVRGAIRTDLILSAEIIAITLREIAHEPLITQVGVLYAVSVVLTVGVYGLVAGLVKLDDAAEYLVRRGGRTAGLGRVLLRATPWLLHAISWIGTVAMLLVGGHILLEGIPPLEAWVHDLLHALPPVPTALAGAAVNVLVGAAFGAIAVGVMATGLPARLWARVRRPGKAG